MYVYYKFGCDPQINLEFGFLDVRTLQDDDDDEGDQIMWSEIEPDPYGLG